MAKQRFEEGQDHVVATARVAVPFRPPRRRKLTRRAVGINLRVLPMLAMWLVVAASPSVGHAAMSADDKKAIEKYLGHGVLGDAVGGKAIDDPAKFCGLHPSTFDYHVTAGKHRGKTHKWTLDNPKGKPDSVWRATHPDDWVMFLQETDDGNVRLTSEIDHHQGVISKYSPGIPMLVKGMKPGDTRSKKIAVKVFDANDPDDLEHSGSMEVTLTYLGNHEVTVPKGKYEAAVVKYAIKGKVGPAKIEDTLYRCFVEDLGVVARVEVKNISAVLIYHDTSKMGMVLEGKK